ncbi:MAG: Ni/Fe-hydrogenase, b-type cytochrome subunit [Bacteroidales bacterium]|nr:Ni/Fe-hydrogenase, b-type cytochrome subunit [Bacteroidales bacterium]
MARYVHTPRNTTLREIYVWEFPVRLYHWVNVVSILVLCVTGYLIGNPIVAPNIAEASFSFMFGTIRFIHFVAAFVFFFNFVVRLYWGFAGNKFARWYNFIPFKKKQWQNILSVLKVDILQVVNKKINDIGHNSLASFTYFLTFLAFVLQSLTGFGMYAAMSDSWFPKIFVWIVPLLGGDLATRNIHHILMWVFILFAMIHIYLVFYHDYIERRGVTSSMIGGWKFIEEDVLKEEGEI